MVLKKYVLKTSIFELPGVENWISRLSINPLGEPPPPPAQYPNGLIPKWGEKDINTA